MYSMKEENTEEMYVNIYTVFVSRGIENHTTIKKCEYISLVEVKIYS